jgi:hypothetical protein
MSIRTSPIRRALAKTSSEVKTDPKLARSLRSTAQLRKTGLGGEKDTVNDYDGGGSSEEKHADEEEEQ